MGSTPSDKPSSAPQPPDEPPDLDLYEAHTHPFVLKIWLEAAAEGTTPAVWRGHITHVPSQRQQYVQDLKAIVAFIAPYLEQMGVEVQLPWDVGRRT
ncbi:MAG TPA: hypothetical protein PKE64_21165 [Anaerolineae bacterium]|nr:hypothetical protein [Anaerolineae bacterium]